MTDQEVYEDRRPDGGLITRCDSTTFVQQTGRVRWQKPRNTWERLFGPKANFWKCAKCGEEFSRKPEGQCNADISAQQPNFGANVLKRGIE
ncbi:hypothetical protein KKD19_05225 [Patescibacteria group bacterium]|nr:hypothetical protein [Patescibacteria group bacterium]